MNSENKAAAKGQKNKMKRIKNLISPSKKNDKAVPEEDQGLASIKKALQNLNQIRCLNSK